MRAKAGLVPVAAALVTVLAGVSLKAGFARAEDDCLTAPNGAAPAGSHWYYHEDRATQRKCWHVRPKDQAAPEAAAQEQPEAATPVSAASSTVHTPEHARSSIRASGKPRAGAATRADAPAPAGAETAAWPDPPAPANAETVAWPQPPSPAGTSKTASPEPPQSRSDATVWPEPPSTGSIGKAASPEPPSQSSADTTAWPEPPAPAATAPAETVPKDTAPEPSAPSAKAGNDAGSDKASDLSVIGPVPAPAPTGEMSTGLVVIGAIGLMVAGLYMRSMLTRTVSRPRMKKIRQRAATDGVSSERKMPAFPAHFFQRAQAPTGHERSHDESVEALRKLLQVLDREAA